MRAFWKSQSGNFAMMLGLILPMILSAIGLAVDVATIVNARTRMQTVVDAAVLASSRLRDKGVDRQDTYQAFVNANIANDPTIYNISATLKVEEGLNYIETTGSMTGQVGLHFLHFLDGPQHIKVRASAYEAADTLELAMVLDNTGSMGSARMKSLRDAATALVNILEAAKTNERQIKAALVPFVTAVNVKGTGYDAAWIDKDGVAPYNGVNFDAKSATQWYNHLEIFKHLKVDWKGCVEARPYPYNFDDTPPTATDPYSLFVPYLAPDNPGAAAKSPNSSTAWNNSYLGDSVGKSESAKQKDIARYLSASTPRFIDETSSRTTGPNYACPTPIEPLTEDLGKLKTQIGKMIHWEGSGTNVSEGLAWGMRVLSPGEPYTQGLPFNSERVSKKLVVFTDGENTVFGASSETFNTADYGAYSFLDSGRLGTTSRSTALTAVNNWTQHMCTKLKDQGVEIFTVLLGADTTANRQLYSKCASKPSNYFPTDDVSQLKQVFEKIGRSVARLYLTQ